jgi:hypothetical protein
LVGLSLVEFYQDFVADLLAEEQVNIGSKGQKSEEIAVQIQIQSFRSTLVQKFQSIQDCCILYNKLVGLPLLVTIFSRTVLCVSYFRNGINSTNLIGITFSVLGVAEGLVTLFLIGKFGQHVKTVVSLNFCYFKKKHLE